MTTQEHFYSVADFTFVVCLPRGIDADRLLPSFSPFRVKGETATPVLFRFAAVDASPFRPNDGAKLEESQTDIGLMRLFADNDCYAIEMTTASGMAHSLRVDGHFSLATLSACWADPLLGCALSSMLRVVLSQAVLPFGAVSLHAVALLCRDRGYLFMGRSGMGKSTHARLWLESVEKCELLNDDNPTVRLYGDHAFVYGTPWSGKTPCYRARRAPLSAAVRLKQASANRFTPRRDVEAFMAMLPSCAVFPLNSRLHDCMCDTLVRLSACINVGFLECLPDTAAAKLCASSLGATEN